MVEIIYGCNIIVMSFKCDIWIDKLQSVSCGGNFAKPCLVGLEEQSVHVGQLYFVIVKQQKLEKEI